MKKNNKSLMFVLTALLVLIVAVEVSATDISNCPSGMVSYWKFDGSLADELGAYNAAMGPYGSYTTGNINQGLYGRVGCSNPFAAKVDNFPNLDSFTLEAWVKPGCPPNSWQGSLTINKHDDMGSYNGIGYVLFTVPSPYGGSNYKFQLQTFDMVNGKSIGQGMSSPLTYSCNSWSYVVLSRDRGNEWTLFVNGQEVASILDNVVGSLANNEPLMFHGYTSGGCGWGMSAVTMDEIAVYNRVLSDTEVQQHYQNGLAGMGYCEAPPCTDADGDGFAVEGGDCGLIDCDDNDDTQYPGTTKVTDENLPWDDVGECQVEISQCDGTTGNYAVTQSKITPQTEVCDGLDNDCDGIIDGMIQSCYTGPSGTEGVGISHAGTTTCTVGIWGACEGEQTPEAETCNGLDDNCDGTTDEGVQLTFYADADADNYGNPYVSTLACTAPAGYVADNTDNCPDDYNPDQSDFDSQDGGDACDPDDDNDGVLDVNDLCKFEDARGFDANSDGCVDTAAGLQQAINSLPNDMGGVKNSLLSKADNALSLLNEDKDKAAVNVLRAFINQVQAQKGKKVPKETADMLIAFAKNVIAQIG